MDGGMECWLVVLKEGVREGWREVRKKEGVT